jgi:hypothetical protein
MAVRAGEAGNYPWPEDALPRWQFIGTSADPQQREDAISSCISQRAGLNWPSRLAANYQGGNIYFFELSAGNGSRPGRAERPVSHTPKERASWNLSHDHGNDLPLRRQAARADAGLRHPRRSAQSANETRTRTQRYLRPITVNVASPAHVHNDT